MSPIVDCFNHYFAQLHVTDEVIVALLSALNKLDPSAANATSLADQNHQPAVSGGFNVTSVDLIAMVVSDAGLASTEPQWWNASPLGCILLGLQPRGGWQVMQRAVQWGGDQWARCFGVTCKVPILYAYFACSIRNRLEVWQSERFISPMEDEAGHNENDSCAEQSAVLVEASTNSDGQSPEEIKHTVSDYSSTSMEPIQSAADSERARRGSRDRSKPRTKPEKHLDTHWKSIDRGLAGVFAVRRPTKLIDGSRGGQAFVCSLFCPEPGKVYGVEEQARLQLLSVMLVVAGLAKNQTYNDMLELIREDFEVSSRLGVVFQRLLYGVLLSNVLILALVGVVFYAMWYDNLFDNSVPYAIQLCSLLSWASGAVGLMMMGGNPRVQIDQSKPAPKHIQRRLDNLTDDYVRLEFGSLHGSVFVNDRGACGLPSELVKAVCRWRLRIQRSWYWYLGMAWFAMFLAISIALQIAGSTVATTRSEIMSIVILIATSVLRGAGISGPESWMIPRWKRRRNARYAVKLQGQIRARVSVGT